MNKIKQSAPSREDGVTSITFWGTIAMAVLLALLASYFASVVMRQLGPLVTYIALAVFLLAPVASVISIVLVINRRQELAAKLAFYATLALGVMSVALFQGRALSASLSVLVISVIAIGWLFSSQVRRQSMIVTAVVMVLMWTLEWINPFWRIQMQAAKLGLVAAALFALILGILVFLQARKAIANSFLSLSLRAKLLSSIVSITGLALLVYGVIFLYRTQQSQGFWSNELQSTVQQQSQQQITSSVQFEANTADQALSKITNAVQQLADYQATLFSTESYVGQGGYWDGNSKLILHSAGQYGNSSSDPANVFIPNTVTLSPTLIADLNTSRYLDFSAPAVLKDNLNIVAIYYTSADNYSVYYPNIDLISLVPPDFDLTAQTFYTVATPKNDPERKAKWTDPYQDPAGTGLIVTTSVPVYDQNNQFRGVMSADVQLSKISEQISTVKLGKSGFAFLIDPAGHIIAMPDAGYKLFDVKPEVVPVGESPKTTILGLSSTDIQSITKKMVSGENGLATATVQNKQYYVAYDSLPVIGYSIGLIAPRAELDAAYLEARTKLGQETQTTRNLSILILLIVLLAAGGVSLLLGRFLSTPLTRLTETATEVAKGNLQVRAEVQTKDEIGILASTFNTMTSRLQEILGTLEQRVADRTRNLELAAEVGRAVSQVRSLDVMLKDACDLILKEFSLYYVQVYLADPSQTTLKLEAGTGTVGAQLVGRGHSLPLNTGSINGRAATEKRSVVIADTAQSATFRQNPLLPDTRGEMAVPLIVANKVVGVLDMQSSNPGVLTDEILPAFEALAGQLAVAVQNANLLAETEQARAQVEAQARRLVQQGWREHLDAIHEPEQLGFVFDHNQVTPLADGSESQLSENAQAVSAPISVTGESLGSLVVELEDEAQRDQTSELVNVVARQVAQQIENLRLLESAERYRYEAEQASRRLTREGWESYTEKASEGLKYIYDLNEVRPLNGETFEAATTVPLKVRDEVVGKFAIQGLDTNDTEAVNLANAVAERLSAHIEGLRQQDQTQSALAQSEKLFEGSRKLTQATDLQELVRAVIDTMNIPHINRALLAVFNYDSNNKLEGMNVMANWWNGTGHEVTAVGTHYSAEALRALSIFTSPTPVFFNDIYNDERIDKASLEVVKRLNVRAMVGLPLFLGSQQLGSLILEAEEVYNFSQEDIRLFTAMAPQIATLLESRRQFERAQEQAKREAMLNVINQKIQSATSVEAVLQIAARELGHALGAPMTVAQLSMKDKAS
jgi:GAF domain-containing protein